MARTDAQRAANRRYNKTYDAKYRKQYGLTLNKNTDGDIIEKLDSLENKQAYIKELIRADIQRNR